MTNEIINEKKLVTEADAAGIERFVVGALLVKEDRVLLLKRKPDDFMGGIFELPSGKVEPGESLLEALAREVREETALEIRKVKRYLGSFDYPSGSGKPTRQFNFLAEPAAGNPQVNNQEHDEFLWAGPEDKVTVSDSVLSLLQHFWKNQ